MSNAVEILAKQSPRLISRLMYEMLAYNESELMLVAQDGNMSAAQRIAATQTLLALKGVGASVDRLIERTEGGVQESPFVEEVTTDDKLSIDRIAELQIQLTSDRARLFIEQKAGMQ